MKNLKLDENTPQTKMNMYGRLVSRKNQAHSIEHFFARQGADPLKYAFEKKTTVHAGMNGQAMSPEQAREQFRSLRQIPRTGRTAAYLHIPFCRNHCLYCGFFNLRFQEELATRYVEELVRELRMCADDPAVNSGPVHCVYIGGGTPSDLAPDDLRKILTAVRNCLPLANDCEITVEARILGFDDPRMEACLEGGVNRFSLGVQTFDSSIRKSLGRLAEQDQVQSRLQRLASHDQAAVIIDLIYGLPGQTMAGWEKDIALFLELGLDGVDLYQLNVFKGSPLMKAVEKGLLPPAATVPEQAEMFARGVDIMNRARFSRLSVSHWGRSTRERNIYNMLVKGRGHCLAYGAGAGGNLFDYFMFNTNKVDEYMAQIRKGQKPLAMMTEPPANVSLNKGITSGLEKLSLDLKGLGADLDKDLENIFQPLLSQWEEAGLVSLDNGWVELTMAGQFWQVNLAQSMIDYYKIANQNVGG